MSVCVINDSIAAISASSAPEEITFQARCAGDYASEAQLRTYLKNLVKSDDDRRLLMALITRYSRLLDTACQVEFGHFDAADKSASARQFVLQSGASFLPLSPYVEGSLEAISINGRAAALNNFIETGDGLQFNSGFLSQCCGGENFDTSPTTAGGAIVYYKAQITARWGNGSIRHDVTEAILSMVAQAFRRREPTQAVINGAGEQQFDFERRTIAWRTIVETELRKNRWREFSPA